MIKVSSERKNKSGYFLYRVQQSKMKELWDNKENEIWEFALK